MNYKHNNIAKQICSIVLSVAMIFSVMVIPNIAFAEYDTSSVYSDKRADISFEFMGVTNTAVNRITGNFPKTDLSEFSWTPNSYVWVGVYVEHMDRLSDLLNSEGLGTLTTSMFYNKKYLTFTPSEAVQAFIITEQVLTVL